MISFSNLMSLVVRGGVPVRAEFKDHRQDTSAQMKDVAQFAEPSASPADNSYAFPVSFAQQRLWFLDRLAPGGTFYNIAWSLRLTGLLNAAALEKSLNEVVRRHEILRTTFAMEGGEPVQVVAGAPPSALAGKRRD